MLTLVLFATIWLLVWYYVSAMLERLISFGVVVEVALHHTQKKPNWLLLCLTNQPNRVPRKTRQILIFSDRLLSCDFLSYFILVFSFYSFAIANLRYLMDKASSQEMQKMFFCRNSRRKINNRLRLISFQFHLNRMGIKMKFHRRIEFEK